MDEEEYQQYIDDIDELDDRAARESEEFLLEQCRDENGHVVPGCSYVLPAPTYS